MPACAVIVHAKGIASPQAHQRRVPFEITVLDRTPKGRGKSRVACLEKRVVFVRKVLAPHRGIQFRVRDRDHLERVLQRLGFAPLYAHQQRTQPSHHTHAYNKSEYKENETFLHICLRPVSTVKRWPSISRED